MREHEKRYRTQIGKSSGETARAQYRKAADKKAATQKNSKMTYDQYLEQVKDAEKLIEVDDDSRWTKFKEMLGEYFEWLGDKKDKYAPIAKEKAKKVAKKQASDDGIPKKALKYAQKRLKPLQAKYGAKNVRFAGLTGIVVLVLLGGFLMLRGGGESELVVTTRDADGQVAGSTAPTPDPDFNVLTPDEVDEDEDVFFDPAQGVASYQDAIGDSLVTISQQPLTEEQKGRRDAFLSEVATNLFAEVSFPTQFGTTHLASAPDDTGDQVAVFMTEDLLIFIRTREESLDPIAWTEYINTINN